MSYFEVNLINEMSTSVTLYSDRVYVYLYRKPTSRQNDIGYESNNLRGFGELKYFAGLFFFHHFPSKVRDVNTMGSYGRVRVPREMNVGS